MGFTSEDDLLNQMTVNGKADSFIYNKVNTVAGVAGTWTDYGIFSGEPIGDSHAGTSLTYVPTDSASTGAPYVGGNVSPATKHMLCGGAAIFAAAGAPWFGVFVDQVGYVPLTGADVTAAGTKTITMTALGAGDRYANGEGLRAYISCRVAPTAGGPNIVVNYKRPDGTSRATPSVSSAATPVAGQIIHSGGAASRVGPFLPLQAGDTGISDLESITLTAGTLYTGSGVLAINLVKKVSPIFSLPANGLWTPLDFKSMLPSLPRFKDGAMIKMLVFQTGATTQNMPLLASMEYAWGG